MNRKSFLKTTFLSLFGGLAALPFVKPICDKTKTINKASLPNNITNKKFNMLCVSACCGDINTLKKMWSDGEICYYSLSSDSPEKLLYQVKRETSKVIAYREITQKYNTPSIPEEHFDEWINRFNELIVSNWQPPA